MVATVFGAVVGQLATMAAKSMVRNATVHAIFNEYTARTPTRYTRHLVSK